jgi:Uma2 family endonuclease
VGEYWLIDPQRRRVEFYQRDASGLFATVPPDADGIYRSREIDGFWIRADWLWQSPLPPVPAVLKEMGLI